MTRPDGEPSLTFQFLEILKCHERGHGCKGNEPVFVGFNAPFDWSFVNYYFHRYLGQNPFGFTALDIKAYYMGATGCRWDDTRSSRIAQAVKPTSIADHDALRDAQYQAELFRLIRECIVREQGALR